MSLAGGKARLVYISVALAELFKEVVSDEQVKESLEVIIK